MPKLISISLVLVLVFDVADVWAIQDIEDENVPYLCEDEVHETEAVSGWSWVTEGSDGDVYSADVLFPGLLCVDCRDPDRYPVDFAAFAYNAYFGENPWGWGLKLGIPFRVYNLAGEWTVIWFENVLLDRISFLPDTMTIVVRLQTGRILRVEVLEEGPDMPIGGSDSQTTGGGDQYDYSQFPIWKEELM
jgi:hypothetical protein